MPKLSRYAVVVPVDGKSLRVGVEANYSTIEEDGVLRFWTTADAVMVAAFQEWVYVIRETR